MTSVLIKGELFRAPEEKTSKGGNLFATATVRVRNGDGSDFWRIAAFSETARAELLRLSAGESVAIQGVLKVSLWSKDEAEVRVNLECVADHVLALRQPPKERKSKEPPARSDPPRRSSEPLIDDDIPF
jgi:single-stranded DNA-binding protein